MGFLATSPTADLLLDFSLRLSDELALLLASATLFSLGIFRSVDAADLVARPAETPPTFDLWLFPLSFDFSDIASSSFISASVGSEMAEEGSANLVLWEWDTLVRQESALSLLASGSFREDIAFSLLRRDLGANLRKKFDRFT